VDYLDWGRALAPKPWNDLTSPPFKKCDVDRKNMIVARGRMLVRERGSKVRMYRSRVLNGKRRASNSL
jgi:hypothetical protein